MADAYAIQLAQAVQAALDAAELSMPITVIRAYRPRRDLKDLADPLLTVAPHAIEIERESRGGNSHEYQVDVAVQQKLVESTPEEDTDQRIEQADALMRLVEEVADWALPLVLTSPVARCLRVSNEPAFSPQHWDEYGLFTSVLQIVFKCTR